MSSKFIAIRPIPFPDETVASVISRAAALNGHINFYHMLRGSEILSSGTNIESIFSDREKYKKIIDFLGIEDISNRVIEKMGHRLAMRLIHDNLVLPARMCRKALAAYCPLCLQESSYWRKNWVLKPYVACTLHNCFIYEECGYCYRELESDRSSLCYCGRCGNDLRLLPPIEVESDTSSWFIGLLKSKDQSEINDFVSYFSVFTYSGCFQVSSFDSLSFAYYCMHDVSKAASLFHNLLLNVTKQIHPRYFLFPLLDGHGAPEKTAKKILTYLDFDYLPPSCPGLILTRREAAVLLGTDENGFKRLLDEGVLEYKRTSHYHRIFIPNFNYLMTKISRGDSSVSRLMEWLSVRNREFYSVSQAARYLGVGKGAINSLVCNAELRFDMFEFDGFVTPLISIVRLDQFHEAFNTRISKINKRKDDVSVLNEEFWCAN